ncbi:MAG: hypothetical protein L3K26_15345, partial [Candidatus Hydrogenedentes bacterium]|nr:hypothetical protein [Candidatus Hydrogenedentota bacterium]
MTWYLAVEGGGTRTVAGFYEDTRLVAKATAGPSNPLAYGTAATAGILAEVAARLVPCDTPDYTLLAGISGVTSEEVARDISAQLGAMPGLAQVSITTDLHPLLFSNAPDSPGVLAIAGTGASVLVRSAHGGFRRLGGRGSLMGDEGGAYQIAVAALRAVAQAEDGVGPATTLQTCLPAVLGLPDVDALVPWSLSASKQALAALAKTVAEAAEAGDAPARNCITVQAECLARLTCAACATVPEDLPIPLFLQGGVVEHCPLFREHYLASVAASSRLVPEPLRVRGHQAVLALRGLTGSEVWCHHRTMGGDTLAPTEGQSNEVPPID